MAIGVLLAFALIMFPSKSVFFCNADDFRKFTQIQNLVDQHMDDYNNDRVEQLNILPWDMSKMVFVIWPETQPEEIAKPERLVVKKSIGDSDEETSFNENDVSNPAINEGSTASERSISVGYEEIFYYNDVAKGADKLF